MAAETKWTPGPWALETVQTTCGSCHKIGSFPSAGARKEVPACVYADNIRIGLDEGSPIAVELLANARLIAAAPDLYEALQRLEQFGHTDATWDFALRAMAKARGDA
ncbi:hypothetical protein ACP93_02500 [Xanthomonas sp. NCPPB 1128]|uniref:hypothetical protein n=1 Tax=Xanthomonas sp. NCPPB 1128 TaxID=1775876 RepID=UPI00065ABF4E|nr:hypothetical protein [Xanthomonas sp. NCPPB 1128]KMM77055.1 hypothetical protein ACP93_02235 [Xanthomonas sp. NCPPB 1128]KMM77099.1 hypothetical protein ACP93_02500 [Xanthomonas sp. NCPPB 1128]